MLSDRPLNIPKLIASMKHLWKFHIPMEEFNYHDLDEAGSVACNEWLDELGRLLKHGIAKAYYDENMPWSYGLGIRLCTRSGWLVVTTTEDGLLASHDREYRSTFGGLDVSTEVVDHDGTYYPDIIGNILAARNLISQSEWYMVDEDAYQEMQEASKNRKAEWIPWHHDKVWQALDEHPKMVSMEYIKWIIGTTPSKKRKRKKVTARPMVLQAQLDLQGIPPGPWFDLQLWHQANDEYDLMCNLIELQSKTTDGFLHTSTEPWGQHSHLLIEYMNLESSPMRKEIKKLVAQTTNRQLGDRITNRTSDMFDRYHLRIVRRPAVKGSLVHNRCDDFSGSYAGHRLDIEKFTSLPEVKKRRVMKKARRKLRRR
jgi:hypothetical protein